VKTIKGPAVFLAQFAGGGPHLQNLNDMAKWAKECGFIGVQLPSWDSRVMDLQKAAESKTYCDELRGTMAKHGIEPTELSAHLGWRASERLEIAVKGFNLLNETHLEYPDPQGHAIRRSIMAELRYSY
jgi:sugar phosphate isomerase/epimerase